jgi:hypothetical protein
MGEDLASLPQLGVVDTANEEAAMSFSNEVLGAFGGGGGGTETEGADVRGGGGDAIAAETGGGNTCGGGIVTVPFGVSPLETSC